MTYLDDKHLKWDYRLGWRAKWMVAYGVLPASLASLGVIEIEQPVSVTIAELWRVLCLFFIALVPFGVTFALVRSRMSSYYLIKDYATRRALLITTLILILSTLVSGAAGIIQGRYEFTLDRDQWEVTPWIESILMALVSLVVGSTLFASVLTKDTELPGLPDKKFIELVNELKSALRCINLPNRLPWCDWDAEGRDDERMQGVRESIKQVKKTIPELLSFPSLGRGMSQFLRTLEKDISDFQTALDEVGGVVDPKKYFGEYSGSRDTVEQKIRDAVDRIHQTQWE